ncbi:MAG: type II toxin-antitoxin system Phd/YefM family antitoxin [Epsilonproteobacteria bacterium]|jgi:PHD/YefM family antitoxin component YafN of YafNO toxin-antitoxin module|nr:type II toxin-antitoxin system Phd/YefM family antitoxin [Campylobacterota bacterium]MDP2100691.1 type II toxin-antitoxin system Phd/YefM family antitoxin [Methylobacter sp.]
MTITPSKLRENLYNLLDAVIETKEPLEIKRNGQILMIVPEHKKSRLKAIQAKKILSCNDDELMNTSWEGEWKPYI